MWPSRERSRSIQKTGCSHHCLPDIASIWKRTSAVTKCVRSISQTVSEITRGQYGEQIASKKYIDNFSVTDEQAFVFHTLRFSVSFDISLVFIFFFIFILLLCFFSLYLWIIHCIFHIFYSFIFIINPFFLYFAYVPPFIPHIQSGFSRLLTYIRWYIIHIDVHNHMWIWARICLLRAVLFTFL